MAVKMTSGPRPELERKVLAGLPSSKPFVLVIPPDPGQDWLLALRGEPKSPRQDRPAKKRPG